MTHVSQDSYPRTSNQKCNPVPSGELPSTFTVSEKPYGAGYLMQASKCIRLQIMCCGKSILLGYSIFKSFLIDNLPL